MDEFKKRFGAAKSHRKQYVELAAREAYKFCFNGREGEWDNTRRRDDEPEDIFTDFPSTVAEQFCGELFSTMTPENAPWVAYEAGTGVPEEQVDAATDQLKQLEALMAKSIRSSNYYDEGQTAFQDAVVGTVSMWIERPTLTSPIVHEAVPMPELFVRLGPTGLDDRFRRRRYAYSDLRTLFPDADWPIKLRGKHNTQGTAECVWGFWKTYEDASNPVWKQCIRVDGEEIGMDMDLGDEGAVPLVVGRFNPRPGHAYGWGPGQRMLPTIRVLDEMVKIQMEVLGRVADPAYIYAHDGMLDLSNGIENGMGYPAMPGTAENFREIGVNGNVEATFLAEERLQQQIEDGFYREIEQRGKTPPSAAQYIGQEQKQLRRMARPAAKLWREFGVGVLKRHEWLERQPGGLLEGVRLPLIESGTVIARPISPLERAQAREDVLVAQSLMGMANEALGEQAALLIDGPATMNAVKDALKDRLVMFRTEEQIAQLMQAMQQMQQPQEPAGATPQ
jgi:hypothetical protein